MANICTTIWMLDHAFEPVPTHEFVALCLMTFRDCPQLQKTASFNLDEVMKKLAKSGSK